MFPVKGWSVSAEKLKVETEGSLRKDASSANPANPTASKPKKRKRPGRENVTADNFVDMWEKVIGSHSKKPGRNAQQQQPKGDNKRRKTDQPENTSDNTPVPKDDDAAAQPKAKKQKKQQNSTEAVSVTKKNATVATDEQASDDEEDDEWEGLDDSDEEEVAPAKEKTEKEGKNKKLKSNDTSLHEEGSNGGPKQGKKESGKPVTEETKKQAPAVSAPPAPKLTPLQASMREKLISARFRHLNETLYTRPSAEAFDLFQDAPEMFSEYHEGFRRQVEVWPENPVDGYIRDIKARAKLRSAPRGSHRPGKQIDSMQQLPLPRTHGTCTIADLGCGDAALSAALQPVKAKLKVNIRSFDLQTGGNPLVERADISNLPLPDRSVDVVVFCLALMGTNWVDFIEEAYRVLRWKGELWISEIKSRFAAPNSKKKGGPGSVVSHSVGNRKKVPAVAFGDGPKKGKSQKAKERDAAEAAENEAALAVVVDGVEQRRQETDVTAFVEALRVRGFLLQRELGEGGAIDLSNKMFVKMHFIKAAPATKGKCAEEKEEVDDHPRGESRGGPGGRGKFSKTKFIDEDEEKVSEAAILKPCVYKLR